MPSSLFDLISTLSPKEKRYLTNEFKCKHSRSAQVYSKIYRIHIKYLAEGPDRVEQELEQGAFPDHLSVLKAQCFNWILARLRNMYANHKVDFRARNLIQEAEILFEKGLLQHARKKIGIVLKIIDQYEKQELYPAVFKLLVNLEYMSYQNIPHKGIVRLQELQQRFEDVQQQVHSSGILWSISKQISLIQHHPGAIQALDQIANSSILNAPVPGASLEGQLFWHHCKGTLAARNYDFLDAEHHFKDMIGIYESNSDFKDHHLDNYIITLHNLCQVALQNKHEQLVSQTLSKIRTATDIEQPEIYRKHAKPAQILSYFGGVFALYEEFNVEDDLDKHTALFEAWLGFLQEGKNRQLDPTINQIYLSIGIVLFRRKRYREALGWVLRVSKGDRQFVDSRTKEQANILECALLYQLGEPYHLEKKIARLQKQTQTLADYSALSQMLIRTLATLVNTPPLEIEKQIKGAIGQIKSIEIEERDEYFDFEAWLSDFLH